MNVCREDHRFGSCVQQHHAGVTTLTEFFRRAKPDITRMAVALMRHWRLPTYVTADDVVQEMMIGCIWAFKHFDRDRGADVVSYVRWNATNLAKRWINRQRGAALHRGADSNASHYEVLFVDIAFLPDQEGAGGAFSTPETRSQLRYLLKKSKSPITKLAIVALHQSDCQVDAAAKLLYSDPKLCRRVKAKNPDQAYNVIRHAVRMVKRIKPDRENLIRARWARST